MEDSDSDLNDSLFSSGENIQIQVNPNKTEAALFKDLIQNNIIVEESDRLKEKQASSDEDDSEMAEEEIKENEFEFEPKKDDLMDEESDGDGVLGKSNPRKDLSKFADKKIEKYTEELIKKKVQNIEDEKEQQVTEDIEKQMKKMRKKKKFMVQLADPLAFNGVCKGFTLMFVSYHYKTFRLLTKKPSKLKFLSLFPFSETKKLKAIKQYVDSLKNLSFDSVNRIIKASLLFFHRIITRASDDVVSYLESEGIILSSDQSINHYILSILLSFILERLGMKVRIVAGYTLDCFEMSNNFTVKPFYRSKNKQKKESTSSMDFTNFPVSIYDKTQSFPRDVEMPKRRLKKNDESDLEDDLLKDIEEEFKQEKNSVKTEFQVWLSSYTTKRNDYFIEILDPSTLIWNVVQLDEYKLAENPFVFFEEAFTKRSYIGLFSFQELENNHIFMKDVSVIKTPALAKMMFTNRWRMAPAKVRITPVLKVMLLFNENTMMNMNICEKTIEMKELLQLRDIEREYLFNKQGTVMYSLFYYKQNGWRYAKNMYPYDKRRTRVKIEKDVWPIVQRINMIFAHTSVGWKDRGREVLEGEIPLKRTFVRFSKNMPNHEQRFFVWWQTKPYILGLTKDGKIPKNKYQNFEAMRGLPAGTKHIPLRRLKPACKSLGVDFAEAVLGFDWKKGRFVPIVLGVVAHEKDVLNIIKKRRIMQREARVRKAEREKKMLIKLWRDVFKSLYIKFYFQS